MSIWRKEREEDNCEKESSITGEESNKFQLSRQRSEVRSLSYKPCSPSNQERKAKLLSNDISTYTFEEFENVFNEMVHMYEKINLENEEKLLSLGVENGFLANAKLELEDGI